MLRLAFDPDRPHRYVRYGRMSSDRQNPRSPDQQFNTIGHILQRQGRPWVHVRDYRDNAISGRYMKKRPHLQRMLHDIRTGMIAIDLILVDTLERLGRNDAVTTLRHELFHKHGVLVLTADSGFADPNTVPGRALGFVEAIRSTEDDRVKAHNVLRGKRDLILQKKAWPGGPVPRGLKLQSVMKSGANGSTEVDNNILVRDPESDWVVERIFVQAKTTGWGTVRLAQFFKKDSTIPEQFRTLKSSTIGYILDNTIYKGELVWNEHATGVINDTRVLQKNPKEEWVRVPDFCEPIVSPELWDEVQALRQKRRTQILERRRRKKADTGKQIVPPAPGLALKYMLSGLVRCGECRAALRPNPTKVTYPTGKVWRRVYYVCPSYLDRNCHNGHYHREDTLREVVIARVRSRLFPPPERAGQVPDWFPGLIEEVRQALHRLTEETPDERRAQETELQALKEQLVGWSMSLANPRLDPLLRADLEAKYGPAKTRMTQIETLLTEKGNQKKQLAISLAPEAVLERLHRLAEVLASSNVTQANVELSRHIDRIDCYTDGRVVLRTTPLGIFNGVFELLRRPDAGPSNPLPADGALPPHIQVKPRRRARLRLDEPMDDSQSPGDDALDIADPQRFARLEAQWFWEDVLEIPRRLSWAEAHAAEVAQLRARGMTMEQLAGHFGKTVPTIRKALRLAAAAAPSVAALPRRVPRRRWAEDHAREVAQLRGEGMSTPQIAKKLGKSDTTIRAALQHAERLAASAPTAPSTDGKDAAATTAVPE